MEGWRETLSRLHAARDAYVKAAHAELGLVIEE